MACTHARRPLGPDEEFTCECCRFGTEAQRNQQLGLVIAYWEVKWEPATVLDQEKELDPYHATKKQHDAQPLPPATRPDAHLTPLQQQGIYGLNHHINPLADAARHKIHIEHLPVNPHTDIMPCHEYRIEVRSVQRWVPQAGNPLGCTTEYVAACIYGPDGRSVQEVSLPRLHALHRNYCQVLGAAA